MSRWCSERDPYAGKHLARVLCIFIKRKLKGSIVSLNLAVLGQFGEDGLDASTLHESIVLGYYIDWASKKPQKAWSIEYEWNHGKRCEIGLVLLISIRP